jgi:hypothetical protein
LAQPLQAQA